MKLGIPRWAKIALEAVLLGLLVLFFVLVLDFEDVRGNIKRITLQAALGVMGFQLALQLIGAFQWGLILREAGIHRGPWQVFWARLSGFSVTYLTPSLYFGGEPVRASVYKSGAMSYRRLYATIALDKYIEIFTKFPCIIAGFAILVVLAHPSIVLVAVSGAVLFFLLVFFILLFVKVFASPGLIVHFFRRLVRPLARINPRAAVKVIRAMKEFARDLAEIIGQRRVFYLAMLSGVAVAVVEVFQTCFILGVLDPSGSGRDRLLHSFVIFATVFIQALVGLLPGNLGGMEATHLAIFNVLGLGTTRSLVYTIILRIGQMSMVLLGILNIVRWRLRRATRHGSTPGERKGADRNRTDA